jgi:hypothetical protein
MTLQFGQLLPGEELTDPESFLSLHTKIAAATRSRLKARTAASPPKPVQTRNAVKQDRKRPAPVEAGAPHRAPPPPSSPAAVAALEAEIDCCSSREHVARLVVHLARAYAPAAALFVVHQGVIESARSEGLGGGGEGFLIPADAPSLFAGVVASGEPFRGAPPQGGLDERILRKLGRRHVEAIVVLPIAIRGRVVSLLYADNGPESLGDASVAALAAVCARVGRAYERLILERKQS